MIDLQQYRCAIGCFYWRIQNQSNIDLNSPCNAALRALLVLGRVVEVGKLLYMHDDVNIAPLVYYDVAMCYSNILQMYFSFCFRLLLSGDVELNPGPTVYKACPQCNNQVHIRSVVCISCGFVIRKDKRAGRPKCTTSQLGYNISTGRPVGTISDTGIVVTECLIGATSSNVRVGRPIGTTRDAGSNVSTGRPIGTTRDAGSNVGTGRPIGTTRDAGSNVSDGRPVGTSREEGGGTSCIEDNSVKLHEHLSQYPDLTTKWNTDGASLSVSNELLKRSKRRIGQQVRFDSKPLGVAMCYCCGSILWSRVDGSHTNLVDINVSEENIPAFAYNRAMLQDNTGDLTYVHTNGKLYSCGNCKAFESPKERANGNG